MRWINNFFVRRKNETKTQIKRSKIKLLYLLAPSPVLLNRANYSAYADKSAHTLVRTRTIPNSNDRELHARVTYSVQFQNGTQRCVPGHGNDGRQPAERKLRWVQEPGT
jgi:hypothetical protein